MASRRQPSPSRDSPRRSLLRGILVCTNPLLFDRSPYFLFFSGEESPWLTGAFYFSSFGAAIPSPPFGCAPAPPCAPALRRPTPSTPAPPAPRRPRARVPARDRAGLPAAGSGAPPWTCGQADPACGSAPRWPCAATPSLWLAGRPARPIPLPHDEQQQHLVREGDG
jgi:hypothetical protein